MTSSRPLAVITGASGGVGAEFARQLVATHDLVLVARSGERLEQVRSSLLADGRTITTVSADLSTTAGVTTVIEQVANNGSAVDLLVNNAGSGKHGEFASISEADAVDQVELDVTAVVRLTRALLPAMIDRGRGGIINLGSTAGFQPTPGLATYAAAKAFVLSFTEALAVEARGTGVTVSVVAPGTIATGFFAAAGASFEVGGMLSARQVVQAALKGHRARKTVIIPGRRNRLGTVGPRLLPRSVMARAAGWAARAR